MSAADPSRDLLPLVRAMFAARDRLDAMGPSSSNAEFHAVIQQHAEVLEQLRNCAAARCGDECGGLSGGFACPICGQETPHHHSAVVVDAHQNKRSRA